MHYPAADFSAWVFRRNLANLISSHWLFTATLCSSRVQITGIVNLSSSDDCSRGHTIHFGNSHIHQDETVHVSGVDGVDHS
jgi:hypothetical protein